MELDYGLELDGREKRKKDDISKAGLLSKPCLDKKLLVIIGVVSKPIIL